MQTNRKNLTPGSDIIVRPAGSGRETKLVLLVAVLTLVLCSAIIAMRRHTTTATETPAWQINAFQDLRETELATFNALISAAPEIEAYHNDDQHWPSVQELRDDYISPFVQDAAWQKKGRLKWRRNILNADDKHIALYLGLPESKDVSGAFLLVMLHDHKTKKVAASGPVHAPYEVWLHHSPDVKMPLMMGDQALINAGWHEIVARRGENEVKKTKDEAYLK